MVASCSLVAHRESYVQYTLSKTTLKKRHNIGDEREALYAEVRVRYYQPHAHRLTCGPRLASGQLRWATASSWAAIDPISQVCRLT